MLGWILFALSVGSIVALTVNAIDAVRTAGQGVSVLWRDISDVLSLVVPLALATATALALGWFQVNLRKILREMRDAQTESYRPWQYLRRLRVSDVADMLSLRLGSLLSLVSDIFMNRIRLLGYSQVFGQRRYRGRIITHEIYDLLVKSWDEYPEWMGPTKAMIDVAETAATMSTKLWFMPPKKGERSDLQTLIACGQMTMCFNLLEHIHRERRTRNEGFVSEAVERLFGRARDDWERLKENPYALVDERDGERAA